MGTAPLHLIKSVNELTNQKDFFKKNVPLWDKLAEFMGYNNKTLINYSSYSNLGEEDLSDMPIYFKKPIPNRLLKDGKIIQNREFEKFAEENTIIEWTPNFNYSQAMNCHNRLIEKGKYTRVNMDYSFSEKISKSARDIGMDFITITYSDSLISNKIIEGKGKNELEAICNACVNFMERKGKFALN